MLVANMIVFIGFNIPQDEGWWIQTNVYPIPSGSTVLGFRSAISEAYEQGDQWGLIIYMFLNVIFGLGSSVCMMCYGISTAMKKFERKSLEKFYYFYFTLGIYYLIM